MGFTIILDDREKMLGKDEVTVICEVDNSYVCVCVGFNY